MKDLNQTFAALRDETRRAILGRLMDGETPLSDLAKPFDMTQTAVTKHVRVLQSAGLLSMEKRGRIRHCRLNPTGLKEASDWLNDYESLWNSSFENLGKHFSKGAKK